MSSLSIVIAMSFSLLQQQHDAPVRLRLYADDVAVSRGSETDLLVEIANVGDRCVLMPPLSASGLLRLSAEDEVGYPIPLRGQIAPVGQELTAWVLPAGKQVHLHAVVGEDLQLPWDDM